MIAIWGQFVHSPNFHDLKGILEDHSFLGLLHLCKPRSSLADRIPSEMSSPIGIFLKSSFCASCICSYRPCFLLSSRTPREVSLTCFRWLHLNNSYIRRIGKPIYGPLHFIQSNPSRPWLRSTYPSVLGLQTKILPSEDRGFLFANDTSH